MTKQKKSANFKNEKGSEIMMEVNKKIDNIKSSVKSYFINPEFQYQGLATAVAA